MSGHDNVHTSGFKQNYQNRVLTIIAALLAVAVAQRSDLLPDTGEAHANLQATRNQVPAPPNAGAQRLKMLQELEKIERRMDSIEKKLGSPLDVNVISMPEVKVAE
jgi:hypothetical protein